MLVGRIYRSCYTTYGSKGDTFSKTSGNHTGVHSSLKKKIETGNIAIEHTFINSPYKIQDLILSLQYGEEKHTTTSTQTSSYFNHKD